MTCNPLFKTHTLQTDRLILRSAIETDFEDLFALGSDPEVWALHSEKDRYTLPKFKSYFEGGLNNDLGAYAITYLPENRIIGFTRYYDFKPETNSVKIGYTFIAKEFWGTGINTELKLVLLDHAFTQINKVIFEIFEQNIRSQKAVLKLGAAEIEPLGDRRRFVIEKQLFKRNINDA
jgi:N-acetyltransferase